MDISVIVPTYNRAHLIRETLDSILAQSYPVAEIIVVDDESGDGTEAVVASYGSRIKYLCIKNSGPCIARNTGVAASTASWLAFCDSDDLWHPDKLRLQVDLCSKANDVQYCFTNFRLVLESAWRGESKFDSLPNSYWSLPRRDVAPGMFVVEKSMFVPLLSHRPVFPSTLLMKRSFFESAGRWNEALGRNPSEDIEFLFRCVVRPPIGVISLPVVGIRKHGGNWTRQSYLAAIGLIDIFEYMLRNHADAQPHAALLRQQIRELSARAVSGAFAAGDFERVRSLLVTVPADERSWKQIVCGVLARTPRPLESLVRSFFKSIHSSSKRLPATPSPALPS